MASHAEIQMAMERGLSLPLPTDKEGGFAWLSLIPILGPLINPIAEGIGKRVGKWIGGRKGGSFAPTMGGSFFPTRGRGLNGGFGSDLDKERYHRGRDTPQMTLGMGDLEQNRSTDKFGLGVGDPQMQALSVIKKELMPFVKTPEAFRAKLNDLVEIGKAEVAKTGAGMKLKAAISKKKASRKRK